jgi:hypothetical protein
MKKVYEKPRFVRREKLDTVTANGVGSPLNTN